MFLATHAGILTPARSNMPSSTPSPHAERSPTNILKDSLKLRWDALASLHYPRKRVRPVSCYALFQGWLLLSQPPGCLDTLTSFPT
jgi:hypothetical protein